MTALDVYLHEDRAGTLERLDGAKLRFAYDRDWLATAAMPLSFSLPLREEPYADEDCRPFFAGLLPEGAFLRAIARAFGLDPCLWAPVWSQDGHEVRRRVSPRPNQGAPS